MVRITPELRARILAHTDLVALIAARVPLTKAGALFKARCPFHEEKTPSFIVTPERQTYHCFGCGAHGNAIDFLLAYERLTFAEAIAELAQRAGIALPTDTSAAEDHAPLYHLLEQAAQLYQRQLRDHPAAGAAVAYLKQRGLSGDIAARFGLGFAPPEWDFLGARLGRSAAARAQLLAAGLQIARAGNQYDRFRHRIMFPIRDRRGRVVGFGGRVIAAGDAPKYLNSPETAVFRKGQELYGLYEARRLQRQMPLVLVVEGYMDVIALAQAGISYAVATLGTATTAEHLRQLQRDTDTIVFCFDGDRAGRAAAWKALQMALPLAGGRVTFRFLRLPEGHDPDSLVRAIGAAAFTQQVAAAQPLSEFFFAELSATADVTSAEGRARLASTARSLLDTVPPGDYRALLQQRLAQTIGLPAPPVRSRPVSGHEAPRPLTPLQRALALLLAQPQLALAVQYTPDEWQALGDASDVAILRALVAQIEQQPELTTAALLERWRDTQEGAELRRLADPRLIAHIPVAGRQAEFLGAVAKLAREARRQQRARLFRAVSTPGALSAEERALLRPGR